MTHGYTLLPEPRSYVGTAMMFGALTALPFGLLSSWLFAATQQVSFGEFLPVGIYTGLAFGVLFGPTMAFFLKGKTSVVELNDSQSFAARLNVAMSQLGFNPATRTEDFFTYKPSLQAGLAAGRISVQIMENQAVIVGPKMYVEKLLRRLGTG